MTKGRNDASEPPFVGALLRLSWRRVRAHIEAAIKKAGYTDLQEAHYAVFSYPVPDGVRPSELSRQLRISRQAANYIIGQMEALGYLERRRSTADGKPRIYLTSRGKAVADVIYDSSRALQRQWEKEFGAERFNAFMDVLNEVAKGEQSA